MHIKVYFRANPGTTLSNNIYLKYYPFLELFHAEPRFILLYLRSRKKGHLSFIAYKDRCYLKDRKTVFIILD